MISRRLLAMVTIDAVDIHWLCCGVSVQSCAAILDKSGCSFLQAR